MSSALAGRFLTTAPPGKPFSSSCKDVALDLRSTLIQCDLTVTHFISKDTVSKQGHITGFWVDLYSVVTLFIQCIWRLKSTLTRNLKFPLFFQLKTFLKELDLFCMKEPSALRPDFGRQPFLPAS